MIKNLSLIIFIFFVSCQLANCKEKLDTSSWRVKKVIDGDTIAIEIPAMLPLKYSIRIAGVDTPEKKGRCQKEIDLSKRATKYLSNTIEDASFIEFDNVKHDKYGGRLVANVYVDGIDIGNELIKNGFAYKYDGGKKQLWCK